MSRLLRKFNINRLDEVVGRMSAPHDMHRIPTLCYETEAERAWFEIGFAGNAGKCRSDRLLFLFLAG